MVHKALVNGYTVCRQTICFGCEALLIDILKENAIREETETNIGLL